MELNDLNKKQLYRLYCRLYESRLTGVWDWPTLRMTYPGLALVLRSIEYAHDHAES